MFASGSNDNTIKIWSIETGHQLFTFEGHTNGVTSLAASTDGKMLVSASYDNTLKVWNLDSKELIQVLLVMTGSILVISNLTEN